MALRPAKCYRKRERAYTRISIRKPKRSFVKGVPGPKIAQFEMGDPRRNFPVKLSLFAKNSVQIRHNALEAARVAANKPLARELGKKGYFMKVLIYPHHILRENTMATGAGADRFQDGMSHSFGKPIGTAAQIRSGQRLFEVRVPAGKEQLAIRSLKLAGSKLPCQCTIKEI